MKSIIIIVCLLMASILSAQEKPDPVSFFPSGVGNVWEYGGQSGTYQITITRDSISDDDSHFLFYPSTIANDRVRFKIDRSLNVFYVPYGLNWLYYKLDADSGETWKVTTDAPGTLARVDRIYTAFLWGKERSVKEIGFYRPPSPFTDTTVTEETVYERYVLLVSGIGEYYEFNYESGPERILQGCIIDGVTYGTVDVEEGIQTLPTEFVLYQNYPNPFNPTTNIEYNLPNSAKVTLKIYNSLGEEVRKLAEGYQQSGKHKITFDARGLPSGVYIYILTAGDKFYSRKMVYAK